MTGLKETNDYFKQSLQSPSTWYSDLRRGAQTFIEVSTVLLLIVSAIAAWRSADLTHQTSKQTIHFQSEISTNETWADYRDLEAAFESEFGENYIYRSGDRQIDTKYEMLNERLLMAADMITFVNEVDRSWRDPQWEDTFAYEFRENSDFFLNSDFLYSTNGLLSEFCTYRKPARKWLFDAFARASDVDFVNNLKFHSKAKSVDDAVAELRKAEATCELLCNNRPGCT